ncbi:MAG: hypothetical protein IKU07_07875 [Oscillospiraceae bacterium]|nr:hypothetical protein [Oscillospiraceae bacterium]
MSLKETLKKIPGLRPLVKGVKSLVCDLGAMPNFLAERKLPRDNGPIRVGIFCQYLPSWHKMRQIYENMRADDRFAPYLICLPSGVQDGKLTNPDCTENDTYEYFLSHGYPEALNALQPDGSWLDLKALNLTYIFYPRPYDNYMPEPYQSRNVSRYSKICVVLYCINTTEEIVKTTVNRVFFRYVYCFFSEIPYSRDINRKNGWLLHSLKLQQSVYYGLPGIEDVRSAAQLPRPAWDFSKNDFRVLWCPRWTTDLTLGGSNFFTFYKFLLDLAEKDPTTDFLFRPHPLALRHFQETGEMTAEEAEAFVARCDALPNVQLDKQPDYAATFWGTSVMICDISGIIPEYFITGNPLIYCSANMHLTLEETTAKILEGSYIVEDAAQLEACLEQLRRGEDPLKEKRQQIIRELFGEDMSHPAEKITEHLAKH